MSDNTTNQMSNILDDLEIEHDNMLTNPQPVIENIIAKANELRSICQTDTSTNSLVARAQREASHVDVPLAIKQHLDSVYNDVDDYSIAEHVATIKAVEQLLTDLKNSFRSRAMHEATAESSTVQDKRYAHLQYIRLRKVYENLRNFFKVFNSDVKLPIIPALPGNYGGSSVSSLKLYMFTFLEGTEWAGEEYMNYRFVAKKLGLRFDNYADFLDWADSDANSVIAMREIK